MDFFCIGVVLHKSHLDYGICVFCDAYRQYNESGGPGQFKKNELKRPLRKWQRPLKTKCLKYKDNDNKTNKNQKRLSKCFGTT